MSNVIEQQPAELKRALKTRLRLWRLKQGFTQTEVADLTGYSVAMVSRAERGERVFSAEAKVKIARRLDARLSDLFELEP